jgi:predicted Rdx family selenoprotein
MICNQRKMMLHRKALLILMVFRAEMEMCCSSSRAGGHFELTCREENAVIYRAAQAKWQLKSSVQ